MRADGVGLRKYERSSSYYSLIGKASQNSSSEVHRHAQT